MKRDRFSTPVLMSFSELALVALLAVALMHSLYVSASDTEQKQLQSELDHLRSILLNSAVAEDKSDVQNDHRKTQISKLILEIDALEKELALAGQEKDRDLAELERVLKEAKRELDVLERTLAEANEERNTTKRKWGRSESRIRELEEQVRKLNEELIDMVRGERSIRKELIGLKGKLDRVIFVLDCSGSMRNSGRWDDACNIAETWLKYINVEECALITFSNDAEVFPPRSGDQERLRYLEVKGADGEPNRANKARLFGHLDEVKKESKGQRATNLLAALEKAYEYKGPGMIVLFTDGAPTRKFDLFGILKPSIKAEILELVRKHDVPINVVGLGDYFDERLGSFLLELAKETKGSFIGK